MRLVDLPTKITSGFAQDTSSEFRAVIPHDSAPPGRASWIAGFPPENFHALDADGIPPWGADMNGVLYAVSAWIKWLGAGGPTSYDPAQQAAIGGYPKGASLTAANGVGWWISAVDNNMSNPDALGANWILAPVDQVWAGNPNGHVSGYSPASDLAAALRPASLCWDATNQVFWWCSQTGTAATAVWVALTSLTPVGAILTGNARNYTAADNDKVRWRSNAGAAMGDSLPTAAAVLDGWHVTIVNVDASAALTISAPAGASLNGVATGSIVIQPKESLGIIGNGAGSYWAWIVSALRYVTQAQLDALPVNLLSGQVYFQRTNGTSCRLVPFNGNILPMGGVNVRIAAAGISVANTSISINGVGGSTLASNTVYLVAFNGATLEFWTLATGHSVDATAGNVGVEIITGHSTQTLVGMVLTDGSGQFSLALSWFNRRRRVSKTNFIGNQSINSATTPAELDISIRNNFLTWANAVVMFSNTGTVFSFNSGQQGMTGIAFDGTTAELEAAIFTSMQTNTEGAAQFGMTNFVGVKSGLSEGSHYATLLGAIFNYAGNAAVWTGGATPFTGGAGGRPPNTLEITVEG